MNEITQLSDWTEANWTWSQAVTRRDFLATSAAAGSFVLMANASEGIQKAEVVEDLGKFQPDFFVGILPDGTVNILVHRSEMGTGIRTALPRIVADELEADWDRVKIEQAPGDKRLGDQNTDGSNSIRFFFDRMRVAGATAKTMLERAAAQRWEVDASECYAENHRVKHKGSDRSFGFGQLVADAAKLDIPKKKDLKFKSRDEWNYIGKSVPMADLDDILTGKAVYGIDARMENQVFAVVARPPVVGGKVKSFDAAKTKQVPGVVDVIEIPKFEGAPVFQPLGGIAVLADSTYNAIKGRDALKIEWDLGPNVAYNSDEYNQQLKETVNKPGIVAREVGDALGELGHSTNVVKADYSSPHLAHASMEPTCAVADVKTDSSGKVTSCHVLSATQNPQAVQQAVGPAMGIDPGDVLANVTLLGSGFGRKSKPDYCVEAAILSRKMKRPVHVTWTREDDVRHDYYHTTAAMHFEAALDKNGMPEAWLQRAAYPSIGSTFDAATKSPVGFELEMGFTDLPFQLSNVRIESGEAVAHTRIGWLRSVCHIPQNFAVSSFADELAHHAGRDPLEYLLGLLGKDRKIDLEAAGLKNRGASADEYPYDIGRLKNVLRRAANMAEWDKKQDLPKGRGVGIACARSFLGYTGHVVEVEVTKEGVVKIPNVWVSLDSGTIVSPNRVLAQLEGAANMGATQALYGEITFTDGVADQSNYDTYQMTTLADAPRNIHMDVVESDAAPAGVGETGVPSFAPALCNAIFAASGVRVRDLPISKHDLSWS